jgi:hypothetical protein
MKRFVIGFSALVVLFAVQGCNGGSGSGSCDSTFSALVRRLILNETSDTTTPVSVEDVDFCSDNPDREDAAFDDMF